MKILVLNYEFPPLGGGAANATKYILEQLKNKQDLEIDLITSSTDKYKKVKFSDNINIYRLDIGKEGNIHFQSNKDLLSYSQKAYKLAQKLIEKNNYDLSHAFFGIPCGYISMKLNRKYHTPYIVSLRGSDVPFYNKRFFWLDKLIFKNLSGKIWRKAENVVANSKGLKDLALESHPRQTIEVIPNGVDTEEFKPKNNSLNQTIEILSVGRLIPRKGFDYLINALGGLNNVKLTIVGDGPERENLEILAQKQKVNLNLRGVVDHDKMAEEYQSGDIFALPSLNEGMSNAILEAMASGLPIITTETGGTEELINNNGFIVKERSAKSIREKIKKYLENPNLIKKHSKKSREIAEKLSWQKVAQEYYNLYRNIANHKK
jgi:L-malate glycosyltransferase